MLQNPAVVHTFHSKFPQGGLSVTPVMPYQHAPPRAYSKGGMVWGICMVWG